MVAQWGGYAAIKYSKKLKASHTLVCCPQWSIDPYECGNNRNGYEKYFSEHLSGMSIKPEDISGHVYVLYDPRHSIDSFHFSKIKYQSQNVIGICTDYIGHHVTTMISGSNNICRMVNAVQSGDVKLLNNIIFAIRKKSHFRRNNLLKESAKKHPYMTAKIALNGETISEAVAQSLRNSISSLLETNSFDKAKYIINKLSSRFDIDSNIISSAIYMLETKSNLKKIISHHDEILVYDPLLLKIIQITNHDFYYSIDGKHPVITYKHDNKTILCAIHGLDIYPLVKHDSLIMTTHLNNVCKHLAKLIACSYLDDKSISLSNNEFYLSAQKDGSIKYNVEHVKAWEIFRLK